MRKTELIPGCGWMQRGVPWHGEDDAQPEPADDSPVWEPVPLRRMDAADLEQDRLAKAQPLIPGRVSPPR
ncbi:MAG: hypothetical protein FJX64_08305 [Alphaproteobacteria bacterium]|nr:hypothetical protein [Alphaproteobacteria bacterium]